MLGLIAGAAPHAAAADRGVRAAAGGGGGFGGGGGALAPRPGAFGTDLTNRRGAVRPRAPLASRRPAWAHLRWTSVPGAAPHAARPGAYV